MEAKGIENWEEKKEKLLQEHPQLTHEDLLYSIGQEQELLIKLADKLKVTQQEIRSWLHLMG